MVQVMAPDTVLPGASADGRLTLAVMSAELSWIVTTASRLPTPPQTTVLLTR